MTIDTGNWTITKETSFEFDIKDGRDSALCQIDSTHYLCVYEGDGSDGWAVVLTVDTGNWTITKETPFEFDTDKGKTPALSKIDDTYYLCSYQGNGDDGWSVILEVTGSCAITVTDSFEFDHYKGIGSALLKIDDDHYLCTYQGDGDDGWSRVLLINHSNHTIIWKNWFEFDTTKGIAPAMCQIDDSAVPDPCNFGYYLCVYEGDSDKGWGEVLIVNETNTFWSINKDAEPYEFASDKGQYPALVEIDSTHFLCAYQGGGDDGWAIVLELSETIRP